MKANVIFLLFALSLFSSGNNEVSPIPRIETTTHYRVERGDKEYILSLASDPANHIQGYYYNAKAGPTASLYTFMAERTKNQIKIFSPQGETETIPVEKIKKEYTFTQCEEPSIKPADGELYKKPISKVKITNDLCYGHAIGYWTSIPGYEDKPTKLFTQGYVKSFSKKELELTLDLYEPVDVKGKKPFILFIHGGAFYAGDKQELAYIDWCKYLASLGYVTASMNYRMGFRLNSEDYEKAERRAYDDACQALRYLIKHAEDYNINPNQLFLAGTSAGAITSLNIAFHRYKNQSKISALFQNEDNNDFDILAVASMWGAATYRNILESGQSDIILFHGDADQTINIEQGHPYWGYSIGNLIPAFSNVNLYGSAAIDRKAKEIGLNCQLCIFKSKDHSFNVDRGIYPNQNHIVIRDSIASFFYQSLSRKKK